MDNSDAVCHPHIPDHSSIYNVNNVAERQHRIGKSDALLITKEAGQKDFQKFLLNISEHEPQVQMGVT